MRTRFSILALTLIVGASLVGCSGGAGDEAAINAAPQPADGGKVESNPNKKLIGGEQSMTGGGGAPASDSTPAQVEVKPD